MFKAELTVWIEPSIWLLFLITWLKYWATEKIILCNKLHFFQNNEITEQVS